MEELLDLARQLRPTALDDLGLEAALAGQVEELGRQRRDRGRASRRDGDFSGLAADVQLVVYRVAQEALSNAARHSGAERVEVRAARGDGDGVELTVADDGRGFAFDEAEQRPRASPACASGRCSSAATSEIESRPERRHEGAAQGSVQSAIPDDADGAGVDGRR